MARPLVLLRPAAAYRARDLSGRGLYLLARVQRLHRVLVQLGRARALRQADLCHRLLRGLAWRHLWHLIGVDQQRCDVSIDQFPWHELQHYQAAGRESPRTS